jgi:thioredoxin reductase
LQGQQFAVIGSGVNGAVMALHIARWSAPASAPIVILDSDSDIPDTVRSAMTNVGLTLVVSDVRSVTADAQVHVTLASGMVIDCDAVFAQSTPTPRNELAIQAGCRTNEEGYVVIDPTYRTTVPPIYAAGDLAAQPMSMPSMQLMQAAADGIAAALSCDQDRFFMDLEAASD